MYWLRDPLETGKSPGPDRILDPMTVLERTIEVSYRHQIFFARDIFNRRNLTLRDVLIESQSAMLRKVLVIVDEALAVAQPKLIPSIEAYFRAHARSMQLVCPPIAVEGGERTKNSYFHVSEIQSQVDRYHIDRHSYILAIGGGALLDMVGLAAATAHRGVRHVRIPTTTLSQDDSGVGVKNGINAFGKKNFIGTFAPPFAVINDFNLLRSCPPRDKRAGYVEAVKVALIRDASFFDWIEQESAALRRFAPAPMQRLIQRCAELHVNHIANSGDPFEFGSARPLDFGHWAAHKLEQLSEYRLRHGEAVAIGIALDTVYARRHHYLDSVSCDRVLDLLEALGFELFTNELLNANEDESLTVLVGLEEFREHLGGQLTITLLKAIGEGFEVHEMDSKVVLQSIDELTQRHHSKKKRLTRSTRRRSA